jgi:anti-sigma factor RsiW
MTIMGNDNFCSYGGRRDEALISYLYGEIEAEARAGFDRHLATCARCRAELHGLRGVREELGRWTAPEPVSPRGSIAESPQLPLPPTRSLGAALREMPAWLHVAAAMLFLGAAAGLANIRVASTTDGFTVRTGWSRASEEGVADALPASRAASAPWRADLIALEQQLRTALAAVESPASKAASDAVRSGGGVPDDEVTTRRVNALIQASERRQQRELALRVAELMRDVQAQRQADLVRIERSLGIIQSRTGMEVMRTQRQVNSLAQQVSQKP